MVLELPDDEVTVTSAATYLSNKLPQLGNGAIYGEDHSVYEAWVQDRGICGAQRIG